MTVIILSLLACALAVGAKFMASISLLKALALFLGLEGTALLASALSPPHNEMDVAKEKNIFKKILWWFGEGKSLAYPIRYNPVYFYGGMVCLAVSMTLSAIAVQ